MLTRPIHLDFDDGWSVDFTDREDGWVSAIVTAPSGRSWTTEQALMSDAIAVVVRVRLENSSRPLVDTDFVNATCQPFTTFACRYLTSGPSGWGCAKLSTLKAYLDERVATGTLNAKGDNCPGVGDLVS